MIHLVQSVFRFFFFFNQRKTKKKRKKLTRASLSFSLSITVSSKDSFAFCRLHPWGESSRTEVEIKDFVEEVSCWKMASRPYQERPIPMYSWLLPMDIPMHCQQGHWWIQHLWTFMPLLLCQWFWSYGKKRIWSESIRPGKCYCNQNRVKATAERIQTKIYRTEARSYQ